MTDTNELSAAALLSLSKHFSDLAKTARKDVEPGVHQVDSQVIVSVAGTVNVGKDETYQPTADIPLKAALALFMKYSGVTGSAAMKSLTRAMTEAATMEKAAAENLAEMADLAQAEAKVRAGLAELPRKTRAGKVKVAVKADMTILK